MKTIISAKVSALIAGVLLLGVIVSLPLGCKTNLDPAGVYHGDTFLFNAERVIGDSGEALNNFVTWEMNNRSILTGKLHSVTVAADAIRLNAPLWFTNATISRDVYSNSVALRQGAGTIAAASNALNANITQLQTQTLSTRALTESVNK